MDLDYVHMNGEIVEDKGAADGTDETNLISGHTNIRLDIDLANNVSAVLDLGNYVDAVLAGGTIFPTNGFFGNDGEVTGVNVTEASVTLAEFLNPALTFKLGVNPYAIHFVPGGSLLFEPRYSDTLVSTMSPTASVAPAVSPTAGLGVVTVQGAINELQPTGLVATYAREDIKLDFLVLPSIDDNGDMTADESAYGIVFDYASEALGKEGSHAGGTLMLFNAAGMSGSGIITVGGGATLVETWMERLTLFGELYFQFGSAFDQDGMDADAGGFAFQLGGQYNFDAEQKPWIVGKLTWLTGDDSATDADEDNFLSYETINDLLIIEDQYFGMNVRSNYMAFKILGGLSLSVGGEKNNFDLTGAFGFARMSEDVTLGTSSEDGLGIELDVCGAYHLNKQTTLDIQVGLLFSSDVLEGLTGNNNEDSAWMFSLGVNAGF
jgi:hypothetical protein